VVVLPPPLSVSVGRLEVVKVPSAFGEFEISMAAPRKKKSAAPPRSSNEIRNVILQYFYDRNKNATSARGKQGFAIKISDVRKELKASHGLTQ
jgi:hypothetical protein